MTRDQWEPRDLRLEGLVLRDAHGVLYEVPCTLIERYRVTEEQAAELAELLAATDGPAASSIPESDAWIVRGGVFAPALARHGRLHAVLPHGTDPSVRAFQSPLAFGGAPA